MNAAASQAKSPIHAMNQFMQATIGGGAGTNSNRGDTTAMGNTLASKLSSKSLLQV
jgi:hypothetical protein